MSESPHELLEQGYTHFHRQDYPAAFEVWSLVIDHPQATEDDRAAARECLELLDQEQARSGVQPGEASPSSPFDGIATADGDVSPFADDSPFAMMDDDGEKADDSSHTAPVPRFDPPVEEAEPITATPGAIAGAGAGASAPGDPAAQSRLAEAEAHLRDARERIAQLEQMVNEANHQKRETEVKLNKAEHDLLSKMNELSGLNVELATVSREVLTKDREIASMKQALDEAGGKLPPDIPDAETAESEPERTPVAAPAAAVDSETDNDNVDLVVHARPSAAVPALFRSIDTQTNGTNGSGDSAAASARDDRAASGSSRRRESAPADAMLTSNRMTLQTMLKVPRRTPDPDGSSRAFNLQRINAGIVRTGLHPRSRSVNWVAVVAAIGLMVSVVLPWRSGLTGGVLMVNELNYLSSGVTTLVSSEIWTSLIELLYLLPVFGISLLAWETVHWSLGYDGHFLLILTGLITGALAVSIFGLANAAGGNVQPSFFEGLRWHLQFVQAGFWTAIGSSALLIISGIVWPRARSQRRSSGHLAPVARTQQTAPPPGSSSVPSRDMAMTN